MFNALNVTSILTTTALALVAAPATSFADGGSSCSTATQSCSASSTASNMSNTVAHRADDIVSTAVNAGQFGTLVAAVKAAGLVEALQGDGPFTVFAPTDDAFAKLPHGTIDSLLKPENRDVLTDILTFHVVPGRVMAADVVRMNGVTTLNGQRADIATGKAVTINGANIVGADIGCSNGIIHVIDAVIMPASDDIVATAASTGTFGTLLAAAKAAGLVEVLQSEGPFTVLAPNDDAFAALPHGTVDKLLKPENRDQLAAILTYHVIPARAYAMDAIKSGDVTTVQGSSVRFDIRSGRLCVDGANIIETDIDASNGVIHVIDRVIMPSS